MLLPIGSKRMWKTVDQRGKWCGGHQGEQGCVADRGQREVKPNEEVDQMIAVHSTSRDGEETDQRQQNHLQHPGLRLAERSRLILIDKARHAAGDEQVADMSVEFPAIGVQEPPGMMRGTPGRT